MNWKLLGKKTLLNTFRAAVESWDVSLPNGRRRSFLLMPGIVL